MIFLSLEAFFWILITRIYWMFTVSLREGQGKPWDLYSKLKPVVCLLLGSPGDVLWIILQCPVVWDHAHRQLKMPVRANRSLHYWSGCNWKEGKWGLNVNAFFRYNIEEHSRKTHFQQGFMWKLFSLLPGDLSRWISKTSWRDICLSPWYRRTSFVFCR